MATRKPNTFQGSVCTDQCQGHRAGYDYAQSGGSQYNLSSPSFTNGMRIAQGLTPLPAGRIRPPRYKRR